MSVPGQQFGYYELLVSNKTTARLRFSLDDRFDTKAAGHLVWFARIVHINLLLSRLQAPTHIEPEKAATTERRIYAERAALAYTGRLLTTHTDLTVSIYLGNHRLGRRLARQ